MSEASMNLTLQSPNATALAVRDPWALIPSLGNLDAYISAVNRIPLLTQDEEISLARRLREHGDLAAAGRLVLSHLRLVVSVSRQYLGYGLPHGDLIQEGNVGLMKAVKRFDPEQGVRLVSFAPINYLADDHSEPTRVLEAQARDRLSSDGLAQALDVLDPRSRRIVEERWLKVNDDASGGMTLHELAAEYGVSAERIRQIEVAAMKKMRKTLAEMA